MSESNINSESLLAIEISNKLRGKKASKKINK
jgi:hypothetical protein